jgi:Predicted transcriptional regulators
MTAGLVSAPPDPLATLREYRSLAPWGLRDLAALAGGILDASGVVPVNAAARARPSERTIRFYVARGLVSPPDGRGTAAVYSYRHLLQVLAIKLRQMEGATLETMTREFAGLTGDLIERRVAGVLGPALPRPDRLALLQAPGHGPRTRGPGGARVARAGRGNAGRGDYLPAHRDHSRHRGADRRAAPGHPPQRRHRGHRGGTPPGAAGLVDS